MARSGRGADRDALCDRLGYRFASAELLERALSHPSAFTAPDQEGRSNQRLEFLGDRVLNMLVAELLFEVFPNSAEGELAPRYNALVRKETCAEVAREIGLGPLLKMSRAEAQGGGREKDAILGDACEALIAAIHLDGGIEVARGFVHRYWEPRLDAVQTTPRDCKTLLQEWLQAQGKELPRYVVVERSGPDHEPEFTVSVRAEGLEPAEATAGSKRSAEQAAAEIVLRREGVL